MKGRKKYLKKKKIKKKNRRKSDYKKVRIFERSKIISLKFFTKNFLLTETNVTNINKFYIFSPAGILSDFMHDVKTIIQNSFLSFPQFNIIFNIKIKFYCQNIIQQISNKGILQRILTLLELKEPDFKQILGNSN